LVIFQLYREKYYKGRVTRANEEFEMEVATPGKAAYKVIKHQPGGIPSLTPASHIEAEPSNYSRLSVNESISSRDEIAISSHILEEDSQEKKKEEIEIMKSRFEREIESGGIPFQPNTQGDADDFLGDSQASIGADDFLAQKRIY